MLTSAATRGFLASALALATWWWPASTLPAACAAEGASAALVVDTGEDVYRLCVQIPEGGVTSTRLIELAGEQHDLAYSFGYGGRAVCMLAGVGTEEEDCLDPGEPFWAYWHGDGSGGWSGASEAPDSYRVEDGDVEGWSWGSGTTASTHQRPPRATFASVCGVEEPEPEPAGEPDGSQGSGSRGAEGARPPGDDSRPPGRPARGGGAGGRESSGPGSPPGAETSGRPGAKPDRRRPLEAPRPSRRPPSQRIEAGPARGPGPTGTRPLERPGGTAFALPAGATGAAHERGLPGAGLAALGGALLAGLAGAVLLRRRPRAGA